MEFKDLELEAASFKDTPTKTQVVNTLRDIQKFLTRMGGALLVDGSYSLGDESIGVLLNSAVQVRVAADKFEAGPNQSGLAVPNPNLSRGPQRVS